jgi:hypothetical protein
MLEVPSAEDRVAKQIIYDIYVKGVKLLVCEGLSDSTCAVWAEEVLGHAVWVNFEPVNSQLPWGGCVYPVATRSPEPRWFKKKKQVISFIEEYLNNATSKKAEEKAKLNQIPF